MEIPIGLVKGIKDILSKIDFKDGQGQKIDPKDKKDIEHDYKDYKDVSGVQMQNQNDGTKKDFSAFITKAPEQDNAN